MHKLITNTVVFDDAYISIQMQNLIKGSIYVWKCQPGTRYISLNFFFLKFKFDYG